MGKVFLVVGGVERRRSRKNVVLCPCVLSGSSCWDREGRGGGDDGGGDQAEAGRRRKLLLLMIISISWRLPHLAWMMREV